MRRNNSDLVKRDGLGFTVLQVSDLVVLAALANKVIKHALWIFVDDEKKTAHIEPPLPVHILRQYIRLSHVYILGGFDLLGQNERKSAPWKSGNAEASRKTKE